MSEIDRFMRSAQYDPGLTRRTRSEDPNERLITIEQKQVALRRRVLDLLVLVFNDREPYERVSLVCGRSPEYWRGQLSDRRGTGISRQAAKLLTDGLRAHVMGIRDHLADVDRELVRVEDAIDEPGVFGGKRVTRFTR